MAVKWFKKNEGVMSYAPSSRPLAIVKSAKQEREECAK
jgi:hypothetical protein